MEAWVDLDKYDTKEKLDKRLDSNKQFPKTLKDFLRKELGRKLPEAKHREMAERYAIGKGFKIQDTFRITEFKWAYKGKSGIPAIAIRDPFGKFKGWFKISK